MGKGNLIIPFVAVLILAGGAGYYFWHKRALNTPSISGEEEITSQEGPSFFDAFLEKLGPSDESKKQATLKEYKDPAGIFSIHYPPSWATRNEQGKLLKGVSLTPPELINTYSAEEQPFVKGLVVAADESKESPEDYFKKSVAGFETGQTEAKNLTISGYPSYLIKGNTKGISYVIYIVSYNDRIVYFNYRTMETEGAHQNDIKKAIDFGPYVADFEAAIASIKFLK